jgi:hypothetical protein
VVAGDSPAFLFVLMSTFHRRNPPINLVERYLPHIRF